MSERSAGGDHSPYAAFVRRILRAMARRYAAADPDDLVELLDLQHQLDQVIDQAVAGLRQNGYSWSEIASATGTTRQAAHARWASKAG